ncbi:hypothetical protein JMJ55_21745 [Belnapia sp. T6]|uniref:Uncharacterized protein n=1 Tax=Belnapia mucosa TaxID=2804532 RepID=A0ABS1V8K7_9PROT|nr:hypothetical protein [Belnapia mucosa]MBL6457962.1 hypothetical protein [Belnapia mucosa]
MPAISNSVATRRALAASRLAQHCLHHGLPLAALASARAAARSALLALGSAPSRPKDPDVLAMVDMAPWRPIQIDPAQQEPRIRGVLDAVERLLGAERQRLT